MSYFSQKMEAVAVEGIVLLRDIITPKEKQTIYDIIWKNAKFFEDDGVTPNFITKKFTRGRDGFLIKNLDGGDKLLAFLEKWKARVETL